MAKSRSPFPEPSAEDAIFIARSLSVEEDRDGWRVGLADDTECPQRYLIIQRSRFFDEQDQTLGLANLYYELDDQSKGFYGGVQRIQLSPSTLVLSIDERVARSRDVQPKVRIDLAISEIEWETLRSGLRTITTSLVPLDETGE